MGREQSIVASIGYVDYETGEIMIDKFQTKAIKDGSNYIYISAKPRIQDIIPQQNTIVTIDTNDITITCIDDTDRIVENKVRGY